ncbi:AAA family ATPase [Malaciobacter mytili]|uniref:AAA family ATPase n=1 Tax=Malaciobacter mytili TaxID=603050 RepID=UPI001D1937DF|nr:SMC family ATPase [Malaciobacter mytili]
MMILSRLSLKNFKKYKEFSLEFNDGLVGIIGKNGSGKSTIFEAICFALYGKLKNNDSKELIKNVNANEKEEVKVELEFEFDENIYIIQREFRGKNLVAYAKFFKNNELVVTGAKDVTTSIITLIKMNRDAFLHTLFASQKELTSLSSLDNEQRKKMIRKLLGLEKIDLIEKFLQENITDLNRDIKSFSSFLLSIEQIDEYNKLIKIHNEVLKTLQDKILFRQKELDKVRQKEETLKKQLEIFEKIKEQKNSLDSKIKVNSSKIQSIKVSNTKLQEELTILNNKKIEYEKSKNIKTLYIKLQEKIKEQEALKEKYLKKEGLIKQQEELRHSYKNQKEQIKTLEDELIFLPSLEKEEKQLKQDIELTQKQLQDKKISERDLRDKIAGEQKIINDTNEKIQTIKTLGKNSKCPTCTRELLEDYDKVLDSLYSQIETNNKKNILVFEKQLNEYVSKIQLKQTYLDSLILKEKELHSKITLLNDKKKALINSKAYLSDIELRGKENNEQIELLEKYIYKEQEHNKLKQEFEEVKIKYEYILSLEVQLQREESLLKSISEYKKQEEILALELVKQKEEYEKISYNEKEYFALKEEYQKNLKTKEDFLELIHNKKLEESKIKGEINSINKKLEENEFQKTKLQQKIEDLNDYTKLKITMGEFKTKINSKVAPKISQIASLMYSKITKGKYQLIEVSNDFDFYIYDDGKKYPIERFSGGEVDLANLVLRIAISKTLGELNGTSQIGFLAFDEVFGSQDESRRLEILEAFHTIKEQYRQIFLISHEMEIKEMFEKVIEL